MTTGHDPIQQQAVLAVIKHFGLNPDIRYRTVMASIPLEAQEQAQYTHKFYIQLDDKAALVSRTTSGDYQIEENPRGFRRLLVEHI